DHRPATRAVELDEDAVPRADAQGPLGIEDGRVDLLRVTLGDQAALLVVVPGAHQLPGADVAAPHLGAEVDVEVFGDPHPAPARVLHWASWACRASRASSTAVAYSSTDSTNPSGTTMVVSTASTRAGPSSRAPGASRSRS